MKVYILWGMSDKNLLWSKELAQTIIDTKKYQSDFQIYQHRIDPEQGMDFSLEQQRFIEQVNNLWTEYCLVCKSIGIIIFLKSLPSFKYPPKQVILCGINLELAQRYHAEIKDVDFPLTLLQNPWDPAGTFEDTRKALHNRVNRQIVEGIGDTHTYNIDLILQQLS